MKRSVIQFAGKTFLVSLPKAWADSQRIRKGQELDVHAQGAKLIISASAQIERRELSLSAKDAPWLSADILSFVYQLGVDEVTIAFDRSGIGSSMGVKASQLLGFEIVDERQGRIVIRNVASQLEEEFPVLLRRCYYIIEEMGLLLMRHARKPEKDAREQMRNLDLAVNKLTDFCKRTINRQEAHSAIATATRYSIARDLEKIGDCYRDACLGIDRPLPEQAHEIISLVNAQFRMLHELAYEFSDEKADEFQTAQRKVLELGLRALCASKPSSVIALHDMLEAARLIRDLFGPIYILELSKIKQKELR